jgi:hypothetical protein
MLPMRPRRRRRRAGTPSCRTLISLERLGCARRFHKSELEACVELSPRETAATSEAGKPAPKAADPGKITGALRTSVHVRTRPPLHREGKRVAACFARNAEIGACFLPVCAMWGNATPPGAILRDEVRQLVQESAFHFRFPEFEQTRIHRKPLTMIIGATGGGAETGAPLHAHITGDGACAE